MRWYGWLIVVAVLAVWIVFKAVPYLHDSPAAPAAPAAGSTLETACDDHGGFAEAPGEVSAALGADVLAVCNDGSLVTS